MWLYYNSISDYVKHSSDLAMERKRDMVRIYFKKNMSRLWRGGK